jgi:signal transduction histidine kinase
MISVMALLSSLAVLILFVIEQREVRAIFEEQKRIGMVIAENIAQWNLRPLYIFGDRLGVEEDIEKRIDRKLIYVVFYDRDNSPFVANDFVWGYESIYTQSHLGQDAGPEDFYSQQIRLEEKESGRVLRILEIEIPIFVEDVEGSPVRWGAIKIGLSLEDMYAEIQQTRLMLFLIGFGGLLLGIGGAAVLAKRITGPIKKLVDGTVKISRGDFPQEIEIDSSDEIGELAQSFKKMSHQLFLTKRRMEVANRRLIQAEKLASIGRLSASIAHEIRNPLTSVKLNIQKVLANDSLNELDKDHLGISQEGISHIENFIKELLNFTRFSELNVDKFSIEQVIDESVKMMKDSLMIKKVVLRKDVAKDLPLVFVDGDKLRQVFMSILRNACEAVNEGGEIIVHVSLVNGKDGKRIKIEISDDGNGIQKEDWEKIFEPFYTTKSTGIGLGLANARKIVEQHKGSIRVKGKKGKGTCFKILIPCEGEI